MAKKLRVKYEKLGRHRLHGYTYGRGVIHVDERLRGIKLLEIIVHEALHELFPEAPEQHIAQAGATLARTLWAENYRRTDNHQGEPLQDGKK